MKKQKNAYFGFETLYGVGRPLAWRHYMVFCTFIVSLLLVTCAVAQADESHSYTLTDGTTVTPLNRFQECDVCPEMIVMPPGDFMMGAIEGESRNPFDIYGPDATLTVRLPGEINIIPHEHPRYPVEIDIPFAMARNEITHREWMMCVDAGGCAHNPDHRVFTVRDGYVDLGPDHPAVNVSFLDIQDYTAWLNDQVGAEVYRLPTEAEWEYAARAGTTTRFAQGDDLTSDQANFSRESTEDLRQLSQPEGLPHLISRYMPVPVQDLEAANGWGLRHMSGNVREITQSCWTPTHISLTTSSAYLAHATANGPCRRVAKGGDFGTAMDGLRPSNRYRPTEDRRRDFYGFRLIRIF